MVNNNGVEFIRLHVFLILEEFVGNIERLVAAGYDSGQWP